MALVSLPRRCQTTKHQRKSVKKMKRVSTAVRSIYTVSSVDSRALRQRCSLTSLFFFFSLSLSGIQEKLGILHNGEVYAVFSYDAQNSDELTFQVNERLVILRKGDDAESEWWWAKNANDEEGYVPRNLLGVSIKYIFQLKINLL